MKTICLPVAALLALGLAGSAFAAGYQYDAAHGEKLYGDTCAACHKDTGLGVPGAFPPLKGNPAVTDPDPTRQIETVLHGVHGPLTINGAQYNGFMPPFGGNLNDVEAADLINWERSSWGNHAKHVTPDEIATIRAGGKLK